MDCPRCGYAMSAFDAECPRCRRLAGRARSQASAYVADARAQGFGDDVIRHQLLQAGWDPTAADEALRHAEAPQPAHEATAVTAPTQTRPTRALGSPGDAAYSPKRREPRGATDAGGGGGKTSARRRLTALVAVLAAAGGAVALWFYIACVPVQTGTVTTCPVCGVTLVNEVSKLRVPRWLRDQYRVDRQEMLCGRCADETIAVTTTTTVYCPDCRRTLRSFTVTGEVKRGEQVVWEADHKWQKEKCNRCRHGELMAQGRKLYAERRYGEAKAAFEVAKKTYPENSDPDRWLDGLQQVKAEERWLADQAAARANEAHLAGMPCPLWTPPGQSLPGKGRWVAGHYVERFSGETNWHFEERCRDVAALAELAARLETPQGQAWFQDQYNEWAWREGRR